MPTFYFVRHGEKQPIVNDPPLSEKGESQADKTGKHLKQFPISKIIASPLLRTQQTSKIISKHVPVEIITDVRLRERGNWNESQNQSFEDFLKDWNSSTWNRDLRLNGGDSSHETGKRFAELVFEQMKKAKDDDHILFVTHGGAIADFLRTVFPDEELDSLLFEFPSGKDYKISECSVTTLHVNNDKLEIVELASTLHLNEA